MIREVRSVIADGLRLFASVLPASDWPPVKLTIWSWNKLADIVEPRVVRTTAAAPPAQASPVPRHETPAVPVRASAPSTGEIEVETLRRRLDEDADELTLLDVREPHETAEGVIPGALLIPMRGVLERISELRGREKPIVVYCAHGMRSANIATHLRDRGLDAVTLRGGIAAWQQGGGAVRSGAVQPN